jgi:hypothetical protein
MTLKFRQAALSLLYHMLVIPDFRHTRNLCPLARRSQYPRDH